MGRVDKIASALGRLEEMECWNTAEVVVMWTWTGGLVDTTDYDAWKVIGHETLKFYHTRGMDRLGSLSRHIKHPSAFSFTVCRLLGGLDRHTSCQVACVRRPVRLREEWEGDNWVITRGIAVTCQLRRLYQLFGYDPTTWEVIEAGKSDKELSGGSNPEVEEQSMPPLQFLYSACDYP